MIIKTLMSMLRPTLPVADVDINFNSPLTSLPTVLTNLGASFSRASGKLVRQNGAWVVLGNDQFGTTWTESAQKYSASFTGTITNILFPSEGNVASGSSSSNVTDTSLNSFDAAIYFGDNSVERFYYKSISLIASVYIVSVFIQMDDGGVPVIGTTNNTGDFCLIAGDIIASSIPAVEHIDGTLYRVSCAISTNPTVGVHLNGIVKYTGQSNRSFKASGWQLIRGNGNSHNPYIKTTTANVTMAAEILTFPATNIPGWNTTKYSLAVEYLNITPTTTERYLVALYRLAGVSGATASDYVEIGISSANRAFYRIFANGSQVMSGSPSSTQTPSQYIKHGFSLISGICYQSINGVFPIAGGSTTPSSMPVECDTIKIGARMDNTLFSGDKNRIFRLRLWTTNLLQSQLNKACA